jgi:hypothetical protein
MDFEQTLTSNGYTAIRLTGKLLEKDELGLLHVINSHLLHGQRMRLIVVMNERKEPELQLIYLPEKTGNTFGYSADAQEKGFKKWDEFKRLLWPL